MDLQQISQTEGAKYSFPQFMRIKPPTKSGVTAYMELALEFYLKIIPHSEPSVQIYLGI